MDKDIDEVESIFRNMRNTSESWGYIAELYSRGLVKPRPIHRTLREVIMEVSQGYSVKHWRSKLICSDILLQINSLCDRSFVPVDEDLLQVPFSMLGAWIPRNFSVPKISNWKDAMDKGVLKSYFKSHDIFNVTEGESDMYEYNYNGDYYDYLRILPISNRFRIYNSYLYMNHVKIPIKDNSFDDPKYFYDVSMRQFAEYERVLRSINFEDKRLVFLGDGIGIGAMIANKNGWNYHSVERNGIGHMAMRLGLINSMEVPDDVGINDILVLMNVEEYLEDKEIKRYDSEFNHVIVLSETRISRIGSPVLGTGMKIFLKNLSLLKAIEVRPISRALDYVKSREPVVPMDRKSAIYAIENKIKIGKEGFKISSENEEFAFNIRTRGYPGNMKYARKNDIKVYKSVKFRYEESGKMVLASNEIFRYYPHDVTEINILHKGDYTLRENGIISAIVLRPRRIRRYEDDFGLISPVYYLYSRECGTSFISYYSLKNVGIANTNLTQDFVIRGDDG